MEQNSYTVNNEMFELQKKIDDEKQVLIKKFDDDYQNLKKIFDTNLNALPESSNQSNKKNSFISLIKKHINVYQYPPKTSIVVIYLNFDKEQKSVRRFMKCDSSFLVKDSLTQAFPSQILLADIKSVSPYLKYLLEHIHDQLLLLSDYNNLKSNSNLTLFNNNTKSFLIEQAICIKNGKTSDIIIKGLGSSKEYINFSIKRFSFEISFELKDRICVYTADEKKIKEMVANDKDKKITKELIKWIDSNKLNENRTSYYVMPFQISFSKNSLSEIPLTKKYKTEYEKSGMLCNELEKYILNKNIRVITANMKYTVHVEMVFNTENGGHCSDFDCFDEEVKTIPEYEKLNNIDELHKSFLSMSKELIQNNTIQTKTILKSNIEIKNDILNKYEKITIEPQNNVIQMPAIQNPKNRQNASEDEVSDIEIDEP